MHFKSIAEVFTLLIMCLFVAIVIFYTGKTTLERDRCIKYGALEGVTTIEGTYCVATLNGTSLTFPVEEIDERALRR